MTSRRIFLASAGAAALSGRLSAQTTPSNRLRVAVMGLGRGMAHINAWLQVPDVEITGLCEVDSRRMAEGLRAVEKAGQTAKPATETDIRKLLTDGKLDVLSIAAPNFWHTPATNWALGVGCHVYVEKPGSHTAAECMKMLQAEEQYELRVQQGTQRRSLPAMREAIQRLKEGAIGKVTIARCWYDADRKSIGRGKVTPPPDWLSWDLWQGPLMETPYRDNLVHYNWHWLWHYGGGELANNGVHGLDLAVWGLSEAHGQRLYPKKVTCMGGRYHFEDDQETPDTVFLAADLGPCMVTWEGSSCHKRNAGESHPFVTFYGTEGSLALTSNGYTLYDAEGKETGRNAPPFSDVPHFQNLADAIRDGKRLHCPAQDGQVAAMICHLGNIAYRSGSAVSFNPELAGSLINPTKEASALWTKEYRKGWRM